MRFIATLFFIMLAFSCFSQVRFPKDLQTGDSSLFRAVPGMVAELEKVYSDGNKATRLDDQFRFAIAATRYADAIIYLDSIRQMMMTSENSAFAAIGLQFRSYSIARMKQPLGTPGFREVYLDVLQLLYDSLPPEAKTAAGNYFSAEQSTLNKNLEEQLARYKGRDTISYNEAKGFIRAFNSWNVYRTVTEPGKAFLAVEDRKQYLVLDSVLIPTRDGAGLSAIIVRPRAQAGPLPVVLVYNIYAGPGDYNRAKMAAGKGYAGIVVNTRGKHLSPQAIEPFEHDANDAYDMIDWVSKQPWCNGRIGMYGGSYLGFAQWSAVKKMHPALKTIVPQVAVGVGVDYPMNNGVYMSYMLQWIHYVSNNKTTDYPEFNDQPKWDSTFRKWFESGVSFRKLDSLEGRPNALFQRWLDHPVYDSFWSRMVPYRDEFAKVNIPVLTTTGYFDDDQRGAFYYLNQHLARNRNAEHYLLIGPYDHGGAQSTASDQVNGYTIDSVARISVTDIVFQWFDHILKDSAMPPMLKDRINFEVTGANEWRSAHSISALSNDSLKLWLSSLKVKEGYRLANQKPAVTGSVEQEIDLNDRTPESDDPYLFLKDKLDPGEYLVFASAPLQKDMILNGSFTGKIDVRINHRDMDLDIQLFEHMPDGKYLKLSYYLARASLSHDRAKRNLLKPGAVESIPINNSFFMSRKLQKGSRIVAMVGVTKVKEFQVNYGSGKDVSDESFADGKVPLRIEWLNSSYLVLPLLKD